MQDKRQNVDKEAFKSFFYFGNDHDEIDDYEYNNPAKVYISEFIVHPDWDPTETHYDADIAIAVLEKPLNLSNEIRHVCLNTPSDPIQNFAGKNAKVYGWGLTEDLETGTELRDVKVQLVDQALCNSSHAEFSRIMSDTSFCAGARDGKSGPCNGNDFFHF